MTTPLLPPHAPTAASLACAADGRLRAVWEPPAAAAGRAPIASFEVELTDARAVGPTAKQLLTVPVKPCSVVLPASRTVPGGQWQLRVRAIGVDGAGAGGWSAPACAAPVPASEEAPPSVCTTPAAAPPAPVVETRGGFVAKRPSRRAATVLSRHTMQWAASWAVCLALCGAGVAVLYAVILAR